MLFERMAVVDAATAQPLDEHDRPVGATIDGRLLIDGAGSVQFEAAPVEPLAGVAADAWRDWQNPPEGLVVIRWDAQNLTEDTLRLNVLELWRQGVDVRRMTPWLVVANKRGLIQSRNVLRRPGCPPHHAVVDTAVGRGWALVAVRPTS